MAHTHTTKETSRNVYWMKAKLEMKYKVSNKHEINSLQKLKENENFSGSSH